MKNIVSYFYKDEEWVPTGRQAIRSSRRNRDKEDVLIEIRPIKVSDDDDVSFNRWVKEDELYCIHEVGSLKEYLKKHKNEDEDDDED